MHIVVSGRFRACSTCPLRTFVPDQSIPFSNLIIPEGAVLVGQSKNKIKKKTNQIRFWSDTIDRLCLIIFFALVSSPP